MPLLDEIPPPELQKNFSNPSRGRSGPGSGPLQPPRNGPRHYNDANNKGGSDVVVPTPKFGGRKSTTPPPNNDEFYQNHDFIPFPDDQAEPGSKTPPTQNYSWGRWNFGGNVFLKGERFFPHFFVSILFSSFPLPR